MSSLQEFLEFTGAVSSRLSDDLMLFHTTSNDHFLNILNSKSISPVACRHFNDEKISYFFLGRPAYKTRLYESPSYWQLPSIFIFRKSENLKPSRIFPFDSGAMFDGRYDGAIGIKDVSRFQIDNFDDQIDRFISIYFESSEKYKIGDARSYQDVANVVGDNTRFIEGLALAKLLNYQYNDEFDDRSKTIEVQIKEEICFSQNPPIAIVCCKEWLRDPTIRGIISDIGVECFDYPIFPLSSRSYYSKIYEICESIR